MSVDRRLRAGLHAAAYQLPTDTERAFANVVTGARRQRVRGRVVGGVLASAVVATSALAWHELAPGDRDLATAPAPVTSPAGQYVVDVPEPDRRTNDVDMSGRWLITLTEDGSVTVDPPVGFPANVDGGTYSAKRGELRTDLFVGGVCEVTQATDPVATYRWSRTADGIDLTPLDEKCPGRQALFDAPVWRGVP
jgi:hypothetical protein